MGGNPQNFNLMFFLLLFVFVENVSLVVSQLLLGEKSLDANLGNELVPTDILTNVAAGGDTNDEYDRRTLLVLRMVSQNACHRSRSGQRRHEQQEQDQRGFF